METGQWNVNPQTFSDFNIIQIATNILSAEDPEEGPKNRLLLLSNQLSKNFVPAFCLQASPRYAIESADGPVVMCFDILSKIDNFELPFWAKTNKWQVKVDDSLSFEFLSDFQKALNLYFAYKMHNYKPIYFWTFLYFEIADSPDGEFIYQCVPSYCNKSISCRRFTTSKLQSFLSKKSTLKPNTLVLLPPYSNPFYVESCSAGKSKLVSIDKKRILIDNKDLTFVTLTKKPKFFFKLSDTRKSSDLLKYNTKKKIKINPSFFGEIDNEIDEFFSKKFCSSEKSNSFSNEKEQQKDEITFGKSSPLQLLNETVGNPEERRALRRILSQNARFPEPSPVLTLPQIPFISTLSTDIALPYPPPKLNFSLNHAVPITGRHTGIPDCAVNCRGDKYKLPANTVFQNWQEGCFSPINGQKNIFFAVFCIDSDASSATMFFRELSSVYNALGLGNLQPIQEAFVSTNERDINHEIRKKFPRTEFDTQQPMCFIVHPFLYDADIEEHVITTMIAENVIQEHNIEMIKCLALSVYTRIREINPAPYGKLVFGPDEFASLFFGFRYCTAFSIERKVAEDSLRLHIAWDPETRISAWSDDACNCFHINKPMDIEGIKQTFLTIKKQLQNVNIGIVMTIVAEGINEEQYNEFMQEELSDISDFSLISVYPVPSAQADFHTVFDDDIVVIAPNERTFDSPPGGYLMPLSTGFVVPHHLTPYQVSIFSHQKDDDQTALFEISQELSYMSWTSATFSQDKRISALPLHIRALLRRTKKPTLSVARFEFLPPRTV